MLQVFRDYIIWNSGTQEKRLRSFRMRLGGEVDYGSVLDSKLIMRVIPSQSLFLIS